ncbi:MAG: hypothetical protein JWM74_2949 [Myxococcaceae bacterium]|nr:hypothetical protein [Myxococcaceae bacterium]
MKLFSASWGTRLCGALALGALAVGCTTRVQPAGVVTTSGEVDDYVYDDPGPNITSYPVYVYEGVPHYYVNGHWYRRTPRGWVYYRNESAHFGQHRPDSRGYERDRHEHRHHR